ncbi:MAG: hypothetical protein WB679_10695 [Terracidiphilus sp.]
MADIQHKDALKLLGIISSALVKDNKLTYRKAAELMGRTPPRHHSRAVAQMCDLLDAAACLTNVIALCPNDHREAHFGKGAKEIERKMILILKRLNGS